MSDIWGTVMQLERDRATGNDPASLRREIDRLNGEIAGMADQIAFWAFQAKWHYAARHGLGDYDQLPRSRREQVDEVFRQARTAENRERNAHAEPPRDIGGT